MFDFSNMLLICVVFDVVDNRSPHASLYADGFDEDLKGEEFSYKTIIGDFNVDLIESNGETRAVLNFIYKLSPKVVEYGATHHTRNDHHELRCL